MIINNISPEDLRAFQLVHYTERLQQESTQKGINFLTINLVNFLTPKP
jgi:hypothetical protein